MATPVQSQHHTATDHVTEVTIFLAPVPETAELFGKGKSTHLRVFGDQVTDEGDISGADFSMPISQDGFHGEGSYRLWLENASP